MPIRVLTLLTLCACTARPAAAQPAACGAPSVYTVEGASRRLALLALSDAEQVRDPYESTAEWEARRDRNRIERQRTALAAFGSRTLRVGGPVSVRYDADAERLVLGETTPNVARPYIPTALARTKLYQGETVAVVRASSGLWGDDQTEPTLSLSAQYPSVGLSRTAARTLDAASNPTCLFAVFRVFGYEKPVIGYDRIEIVSVVHGQPYVWSWTLGDDGTAGTPENYPEPPPPPAPPAPAPPPPPAPDPPAVLDFSEVSPVLIGGIERLRQSIPYPAMEQRACIQGRVVVRFVVEADGRTSAVEVVRSVSPGLDRAAIQAVQRARFEPGKQNGQAVAVRQTLPVAFSFSAQCVPARSAPR